MLIAVPRIVGLLLGVIFGRLLIRTAFTVSAFFGLTIALVFFRLIINLIGRIPTIVRLSIPRLVPLVRTCVVAISIRIVAVRSSVVVV